MNIMERPLKIAYFIGSIRKEDGVARVLLALIREAQKKGLTCVVVTGWVEDESIVPTPVVKLPSVVFPLYRAYRLPLPGMHAFKKKLDVFAPDIIHVHSPDTSAWAAANYAAERGVPIVATHHTDFVRYLPYYHIGFLRPFVWYLLRRVYGRMNLVTAPSSETAGDLERHAVKNVKTIGWGVDTEHFGPQFRSEDWRRKILPSGAGTAVLCVCRLTWEKDLRTLAKAYGLLKERRKDFAMVVAGSGPAAADLKKLMPGAVFLGYVEKDELAQAYASSDILLFPSTTETFGNVTAEAMVSGIVPVVANEGGSKDLVRDGVDGFLTKPKDEADCAAKVSRLIEEPDLLAQMKKRALEKKASVSWGQVFEKIENEYTSLLHR